MLLNIVVVFLCSLSLALILTPVVRRVGAHFHIVDAPSARKIHASPIPRIGGAAIFLSFYIAVALSWVWNHQSPFGEGPQTYWLIAGSVMIFLLGLIDDVLGLSAFTKFFIQAGSAVLAYFGGMQITNLTLPWNLPLDTIWLSLPLTVLWFLLVINAINLVDGLDGLATGVSLFTALVLLGTEFGHGAI